MMPTIELRGEPTMPSLPADVCAPTIPHYDVVAFIGQGGMGRVFKAIDRRLQRPVALKIIRGEDRALVERFLREARAQARIEHEHVCKVYETGEADGQPYIAMQFLPGRSLAEVSRHLSRDQRVVVVRDVADALQAAHRLGIVHRDLKPANVIVEVTDEGAVQAFVVDFGLAIDVESDGLTLSGTMVGTPAFMSPEQARGDLRAVDRRSDVYSLGATLYAALAGRAPFQAEGVFEVMRKVVDEEPEPLSTLVPGLPRDLLTIISKCLEKDPARRYQSSRELCDDLTRFLAGDPIQARSASFAYRLTKKARKHRLAVAIAAIAAMALAVVGGLAVRTQIQAVTRARLARQLGQEAERLEWILRAAQLSPLHDVRPERRMVALALHRLEGDGGQIASGPTAVALGRGYLGLGDLRRARSLLERAWEDGERGADVAFALGSTLSGLYTDELRDAERLGDEPLRIARRAELRARYHEPALKYLRLGRAAGADAPERVEALIAANEGRDADATRLAKDALAKLPWLYEAVVLQGDVALAAGRRHRERAEYEPALGRLREAAELYDQAAQIGRSAPATYEAECAAWGEVMYVEVERDGKRDPAEAYRRSLLACDKARLANADSAAAYNHQSFAEWLWGYHALRTGGSPVAALQRAIAASAEAQRLRPDWAEPHNYMGIAYGYLGRGAMARGEDPRPLVRQAIASFDRAIALAPGFAYAHTTRGIGYFDLARDADKRRTDPTAFFDTAAASYRKAMALNPAWTLPRFSLAEALVARGSWEERSGRDCTATLAESVAEAEPLLATDDTASVHELIGSAHLARAECAHVLGKPSRSFVELALGQYREALKRAPAEKSLHERVAVLERRLVSSVTP
jgi:tetratricopeptide (TPR) repeat protein/predicted Ser/Thr protein kinase